MKVREVFRISAWVSSLFFMVASLTVGVYVLIRGAHAVVPPKAVPTEKKFLTAKGLLENEKNVDGTEKNEAGDGTGENAARSSSVRIPEPTFRLPKEGVMLPKLASPGLAPGINGADFSMKFGPEASNPEPYPDPAAGLSPEELNAQREQQKADRDRRRLESLDERIQKLEERLAKVKSENPNDEQIDRLQKSIERLQKRREDLAREVKNGTIVE